MTEAKPIFIALPILSLFFSTFWYSFFSITPRDVFYTEKSHAPNYIPSFNHIFQIWGELWQGDDNAKQLKFSCADFRQFQ